MSLLFDSWTGQQTGRLPQANPKLYQSLYLFSFIQVNCGNSQMGSWRTESVSVCNAGNKQEFWTFPRLILYAFDANSSTTCLAQDDVLESAHRGIMRSFSPMRILGR